MKGILRELLDDLERIGEEHDEVYDTDVHERMHVALTQAFVKQVEGYSLPTEFGMFSAEGNSAVREALSRYVTRAIDAAKSAGLHTPEARLDALQDIHVVSSRGKGTYDEFIGHADGVDP